MIGNKIEIENEDRGKGKRTNAKEDWSGCSSGGEGVVQLESKWVPLSVLDCHAFLPLLPAAHAHLSHPFSFFPLLLMFYFIKYRQHREEERRK